MNKEKQKKINFENHRKNKISTSQYISIIEDGKVRSGWTNGRNLDELEKDFGKENKDFFYTKCKAEAYLVINKGK